MILCIASLYAFTPLQYPETQRGSVVETLHSVEVADPYRWLEQDVRESDEVRQWVTAENTVTRAYLDAIPILPKLKDTLTKAWNYEKHGLPRQVSRHYFLLGSNHATPAYKIIACYSQAELRATSILYFLTQIHLQRMAPKHSLCTVPVQRARM